jgi:GDP-mannose transporter
MSDKKNEDYDLRIPETGFHDSYSEEKDSFLTSRPKQPQYSVSLSKLENSPGLSILAYCLSSISMTVVNKYVVSGSSWNLSLFYLAVQVSHVRLAPWMCGVNLSTVYRLYAGNYWL